PWTERDALMTHPSRPTGRQRTVRSRLVVRPIAEALQIQVRYLRHHDCLRRAPRVARGGERRNRVVGIPDCIPGRPTPDAATRPVAFEARSCRMVAQQYSFMA